MDFTACNNLLASFARTIDSPVKPEPGTKLYTGVDLGTAYIVLAVVNQDQKPVAGSMRFAQVVKDGLVVDYIGALEIVKQLKAELEEQLGVQLVNAATAYPPGTSEADIKSIKYVVEGAGFEVTSTVDEPTAANAVLGISDGAVVDIGGGTTGVAVLQNGQVVYVADEPTGGTHFSLVLAGALKTSFEEAEARKKDVSRQDEIIPLLKPVMEKVATIIQRHIKNFNVDTVYLAGGTGCLKSIEKVIENNVGVRTLKPVNPLLVTPLGIALHCFDPESEVR